MASAILASDARKVASQEPGTALDVPLRQAALAAIGFDDFSDVHPRLFFWHGLSALK